VFIQLNKIRIKKDKFNKFCEIDYIL
jgi:hypothetical protein